jgi:hypothetical protein
LILYELVTRLFFFFNLPTRVNVVDTTIANVIYLILLGYLMFTFFEYFKHYKLKILEIAVLAIFVMEIIFKSNLFTNIFESTGKRILLISANAIWVVALVVMIVSLLMNKIKSYPGMSSLLNYAIASLLIFAFATTYLFYLKPKNPLNTQLLVGMTSAIPYIFAFVFATKLKLKPGVN